ncbi:MAG: ATP-binding protein [Candidatus Margulisbacteria bacterium]|nr:ATP-binding protein [Candidatus Margulisiibacteriota bacterium]
MYFDPKTKENIKDFFNFELLREELKNALEDKLIPLIAVHGIRRTGKTSLIRVVLNACKKKYVWIDSRDISLREDFYRKLSDETKKLRKFKISRISIKGIELDINSNKDMDYLNKHKTILVIDEAQLLKRFHLDQTIAYIYDNFHNIKIVLSGSDTGMLMGFLGKNNAKAPLYGRAIYELKTYRLNAEDGRKFLLEGSKQLGKQFTPEEIKETIENIDGIIGWLTKYGWHRHKLIHKEALRKTIEEGQAVVKEEFIQFAARAESRYHMIAKVIKYGARWEEIIKKTNISNKQLYQMLKRMMDHGFAEKKNHFYQLTDPLLAAAIH